MGVEKEEVEFLGNAKQLIDEIKKVETSAKDLDGILSSILNHIKDIEKQHFPNITQNINKTKVTTSKANESYAVNGVVTSFSKGNSSSAAKAIRQQAISALEKQNELLAQSVELEKERTKLIQEQTKRTAAKTSVLNQEVSTKALNARSNSVGAQARLLKAQTRATESAELSNYRKYKNAHPELFATGGKNWNLGHQAAKTLSGVGNAVSSLGTGGKILGYALDSLGNFFKSPFAGIAASVTNLTKATIEFGKAAVQSYAEIEAIKTQLGVVFSNQTQADSMFGQISQYAVKSPFGVQQTSELAVLLKQSGVYASDLMDTLRMLGDTAGGNMEKMKRIANNYAQIVSIGKASMLDMRQFAYAGIPIFEAVSKELGVSQQELRKLISDGKVTSDIIEKVFKDLTGINGIFENATEKGAKTLKARLQNLQDAKQLAMGSVGEWVVNLGSRTGNDSFANKFVNFAEKAYDYLKENVNTVNIEKNVKTIAERENTIQKYQELITLAEGLGSETLVKALTSKLNKELSKLNPDEERNLYVQDYKNKIRGFELFGENDITGTAVSIQKEIEELTERYNQLDKQFWDKHPLSEYDPNYTLGERMYRKWGVFANDRTGRAPEGSEEALEKEAIDEQINVLSKILKALDDYNDVTEKHIRAIKEDSVIQAQQLAFDTTNRNADSSKSLNASFNELATILEGSDDYKKKEEEEKIKILKASQAELKAIAKKADENGNIRFNEFSRSEFQRLNNAGAFNATKLDIVEGNRTLTAENRMKLESQFANASGKVLEELSNSSIMATSLGREAKKAIESSFMSLSGIVDDKEFFQQFGSVLNDMKNSLKQLESFNPDVKDWLETLQDYLIQSTNTYEARVKGVNADIDAAFDKSKATKDFVPLWKRILAQYTGLSTQGMTGTVQTLTNYRDDMAIRNMTAGVLSATMKTMGVDTAMSLMRSGEGKQLRGDTGGTFQINWKETKKAVHDFALQLSASTEVVTAYKNGLQAELDTYEQLIAAGYTQGESQDLSQQKLVSSKKMAELAQDAGEQLVNAFGEVIETESGKRYNTSELKVDEEGNLIVAKTGEKIEEQVRLTGNLFEFIKKELPELREEIHEATSQELMDKELEKLYNEVKNSFMTNALREELGYSRESEYLMNNLELTENEINSALTRVKDRKIKEGFDFYGEALNLPNQDIITRALNYKEGKSSEGEYELNLFNEAVKEAADTVNKLINDKGFLTLTEYLKNKERDTEAENAVRKMADSYTRREAERNIREGKNPLNPNESLSERDKLKYQHESLRGGYDLIFKNYFGLDRKSDKIDRYARMATTANLEGKDVNPFGINADNYQNMSAEEIYQSLSAVERQTLNWKAALEDTGEVIKDMGENLLGVLGDFSQKAWVTPFEEIGKAFVTGEDAAEGIRDAYKNLGGELLKAAGTTMVQAGFSLVSRGAADDNIGMIAGGLALAAAGGVSTGIGSALTSNKESKDESKDQTAKLEKLKDDLVTLLKQAREDAIYYENTLRHKSAISANAEFTMKKVNDAIITPSGDVISTHPEDYLIATKTPRTLLGNGGGTPTVNFSVIDKSTGIKVTQQRANYNSQNNTLDFEVMVESKIKEVIASGKSDGAFNARDARLRGRNVIA